MQKEVRIFLLVLIVVGIILLFTQKIWVPKLVNQILSSEAPLKVLSLSQSIPENWHTYVSKKLGFSLILPNLTQLGDELALFEGSSNKAFIAPKYFVIPTGGPYKVNGYKPGQKVTVTYNFINNTSVVNMDDPKPDTFYSILQIMPGFPISVYEGVSDKDNEIGNIESVIKKLYGSECQLGIKTNINNHVYDYSLVNQNDFNCPGNILIRFDSQTHKLLTSSRSSQDSTFGFDSNGTNIDQKIISSITLLPEAVTSPVWKTYSNDKFGFQFKYPTSWNVSAEIGGTTNGTTYNYKSPYLFDVIISTEKTPINRAGHISVLSEPLNDFMAQISKLPNGWSIKENDLKTINLQGKKLIITHAPVTNSISGEVSQQTDYSYLLTLDDKTIFVNFMSINNPEKQITSDLLNQIDQFIATFSSK